MSFPQNISYSDLEKAVVSVNERVELSGRFSELFADANILNLLNQNKNQVIYGRRGAGKTHLLGRLKEYHRDTFSEKKIIPVFIDGRVIAHKSVIAEINSAISLLISYRRFLDVVITDLERWMRDSVTLNAFEKIWPGGKKKQKIEGVMVALTRLKERVRFGQVEFGQGKVTSEIIDKQTEESTNQLGLDIKFATELKKLAASNAGFAVGLSNTSSQNAEEAMKVVYEGLTIINFEEISKGLDFVIQELDADAVAILFDEWSAIDFDLQPFFAEMIRATLVSGRKMFIKFGCIPFLTRLSTPQKSGQTIGFPIGEEVFVDVDLDRFYNPYMDAQSVTFFLLSVLQKHLGATIEPLKDLELDVAVQYFATRLFQDEGVIKELVQASAGVPRDFLRIFARAFHKAQKSLPINLKHVRMATHDFFQQEKKILIEERPTTFILFEDIFEKICQPSNKYIFFVSQGLAKNRILQELWHHRLVHLLFQGHIAYANDRQGTYDIYVVDYGRYILMRGGKKGEDHYQAFSSMLASFVERLTYTPLLRGRWTIPTEDASLRKRFAKLLDAKVKVDSGELERLFDDCTDSIADDLIRAIDITSVLRR